MANELLKSHAETNLFEDITASGMIKFFLKELVDKGL